jgi:hypothetical protein
VAPRYRPFGAAVGAWLMVSFLAAVFVLRFERPASAGHCRNIQEYDEAGRDSARLTLVRGVRSRIYVNNFNGPNNPQLMSIRAVLVRQDATPVQNVEIGWHTDGPEGERGTVVNLVWFLDGNYHHRHFFPRGNARNPAPDTNHLFMAKDQDGDSVWTIAYDSDDDGTGEGIASLDLAFNRGTAYTLSEVHCEQDSAYAHFRRVEDFRDVGGDFVPFGNLTESEFRENPHYVFEGISNSEHRIVRDNGSQRNLSDAQADEVPPPSPAPQPSPTSTGFCNHGWEPECYVPEPPPPSPSPSPPPPSPSPSPEPSPSPSPSSTPPPPPPPPAPVFNDSFETGDLSSWTSNSGLSAQQQEVYAGSWAARGTTTDAAIWGYKQLDSTYSDMCYGIRFKVLSQSSSSTMNVLKVRTTAGAAILGVYRSTSGNLGYRNEVAAASTTSSTPITTGAWHALQIRVRINGASGESETWLDGARIASLSRTEDLGTTPIGRIQIGENSTGRTYDVVIDDVVATTSCAAPVFNDSFETGDLSSWTSNSGLSAQQQEVYAGSWAARGTTTGAAIWGYKQLDSTYSDMCYGIRFKVLSQSSSSTMNVLKVRTTAGAAILGVYRSTSGNLGYRNEVAAASTTSSTPITTGAWHALQIRVRINGASGESETWLDGARIASLSRTEDLGTTPIGRIQIGENSTGRTYDVVIDDVVATTSCLGVQ